jgi:hypothetical protein
MVSIDSSKINHDLIKPEWKDYLCPECNCGISEVCRANWKRYSADLSEYMFLKYKDTYIKDA